MTKVYFRLVKADWEARLQRKSWRTENVDDKDPQTLLAEKPAQQWSVNLPETKDYRGRVEQVAPPKNIKPGFYFLITSHNADFSGTNNQVGFNDCWVSDLSIVTQLMQPNSKLEGFVLNAISGEPVADAEVQTWQRVQVNNGNKWLVGPKGKTDKNGRFSLVPINAQYWAVLVTHKDQKLASSQDLFAWDGRVFLRAYDQTIFFTDRSLYRPGQTISYKAICIHNDQDKDNYHTIANRDLTVIFADVNGKEIAKQTVRTNEFGSVSGSFTAPARSAHGPDAHLHTDGR